MYNDSCYFDPYVNFTYSGTPLQGISSDVGFSEAGHLCLQVPACHAVVETQFETMDQSPPHMRYVLRGPGELQPEVGTRTLVRSRNHCAPPSPSPPPSPPPPPPSFPMLVMQTRPLLLVSFTAQVQTTIEQFNVPAYAQRMSTRLGGAEVGVSVSPGSVVVTTTVAADNQATADQLVTQVTDLASDAGLMSSLYDAPASIDTSSIATTQNPDAVAPPPPSFPPPTGPSRSEEDHSYLALIIILAILVPTAAFFAYLRLDQATRRRAKDGKKPYASIKTADVPVPKPTELSFKFDM